MILRQGTTGDDNLEMGSDGGIVEELYSDNLCGTPLSALCGVSSKTVNRSKGLGHRRRRRAT